MNLFGIGPGELILILILAFIIFGPERLPEVGRTLGKAMREFRSVSDELTSQFREELEAASEELEAIKETASEELNAVKEVASEELETITAAAGDLQKVTAQVKSEANVAEDLKKNLDSLGG